MKTKRKKNFRQSEVKLKKRAVPLLEKKWGEHLTCIGFEASGFTNVKKLKLKSDAMKAKLGGKAAGLADLARLGVPIPPALNLSTHLCQSFSVLESFPTAFLQRIKKALAGMESKLEAGFGDLKKPLLLSVRSGARISMPGMMDTVLNLGLNQEVVEHLAKNQPEKAWFWWDCYRRLIVMFSSVVLGCDRHPLEATLDHIKSKRGFRSETDLSAEDLKEVCQQQLLLLKDRGKTFPQDPWEQLAMSIHAVFRSWNTDRAIHYRKLNDIPEEWGTSVTLQSMVFGNLNENSGTGVVFTRNPSTGEKKLFGEYLMQAQGEDVVAGIRTPLPIENLKKSSPKAFLELVKVLKKLELHFKDAQDVEFTIENSKLYILQTRRAKRTARAHLENLVQFVQEKFLKPKQAIELFTYKEAKALLHPSLKATDQKSVGRGLPASPGAVSGKICLSPAVAIECQRLGEAAILVRRETCPEDIVGMSAAEGILTATGGMTSHAAVVGRGMGKTCVVGCTDLQIFETEKRLMIHQTEFREGDWITLEGGSGQIFSGRLATEPVSWTPAAKKFFNWADESADIKVLANADTPDQARVARDLGAKGIGLCRTEHMFFEKSRIHDFRKMILAESERQLRDFSSSLLDHQKNDFDEIFEVMRGLEVNVRLLDPPLHEFLPSKTDHSEIAVLAEALGVTSGHILQRLSQLHEHNPMLGHRGCRLGISFPEIYRMQIRALARSFSELPKTRNKMNLKIMIPLVSDPQELKILLEDLKEVFEAELKDLDSLKLFRKVKWGTMIEVPRACLLAKEIAKQVDFFSFGTNDLTQTSFGISRDDSAKFLSLYLEKSLLPADPFESLDLKGVGALIQEAVRQGRGANKELELGICGEHGGDPKSIGFFHELGFDSISCSPFRVPIARMAAAKERGLKKI